MKLMFSHKNTIIRLKATKELQQLPHWDFSWGEDLMLDQFTYFEFINFDTTILYVYSIISNGITDESLFRALLAIFVQSGYSFFTEPAKISWNYKKKKLSLSRPTLEIIDNNNKL